MFDFLRQQIREMIREEQQSVYTFLPVIIESVDRQTWTCEVSRKDDDQVLANQIPLASAYTGNGYGELQPVRAGDEAFLHCSTIPLEDFEGPGHQPVPKHRTHSMRDGVLYLRTWFGDDDLPAADAGEYVYAHESGTQERIKPDGRYLIEHAGGGVFGLSSSEISFAIPNIATDVPGVESQLSVTETGHIDADGHLQAGSTAARRARPADYYEDRDADAAVYETDEPVAPILDRTDTSETSFINPRQATLRGPLDAGFYELRAGLPPRREADPDPTVANPANPAYIDLPEGLDSIPAGYTWINVTDNTYRMWGANDAPVDIVPL